MTKLKLKNWSRVGDALTSEELKHVYGGVRGSGVACTLFCIRTDDPLHPYPYEITVIFEVSGYPECKQRCLKLMRDGVYASCDIFFDNVEHITCGVND